MRDSRDSDECRPVVDDLQHAPVTDADTPLIFVALQFFTSFGPWGVSQRFDFTHDTRQHVIR